MTRQKTFLAVISLVAVLCLALVLGFSLSAETFTAQAEDIPISVGVNGYRLRTGYYLQRNDSTSFTTGATAEPSEYVAWYNDGILILNGYVGGAVTVDGDLTILLKGNNTITSTKEGVFVGNCTDLIIDADNDATLNINVSSDNGDVFGIGVGYSAGGNGNVTIKGKSNVNIFCQTTNYKAFGIYSKNVFSIVDQANLDITCVSEKVATSSIVNYGIHSNKTPVSNTTGSISIDTSGCATESYCFYSASNPLVLQNGNYLLKYKAGSYSYAFYPTIENAPDGYVLHEKKSVGEAVLRKGEIHTVTVENATDYYEKKSNQYVVGETVTVKATIDGLPFVGWEGEGVTFADSTQRETTFVVGSSDVTVRAVYNVFAKQPVFERINDDKGSISVQLNKQTSASNKVELMKSTDEKDVNVSFSLSSAESCSYVASTVWASYTPKGIYRIRVEYNNSYYFYSDPFEIDYTDKTPSASVSDVSINGKKGIELTPVIFDVILSYATFKAIPADTDVSGWFNYLTLGLVAKISAVTEGATSATITISGTPKTTATSAVYLNIPVEVLASGNENKITSKYNSGAKFAIEEPKTVQIFVGNLATANGTDQFVFVEEGTLVTIEARPQEGKVFDRWSINKGEVTLADPKSAKTTLIAPSMDVSLSPTYIDLPTYNIDVVDGQSWVGELYIEIALSGTTVTIIANDTYGRVFDKWEVVSGSVTLEDATSATTTFVMPEGDVKIKATYKWLISSVEATVKVPVAGESQSDCTPEVNAENYKLLQTAWYIGSDTTKSMSPLLSFVEGNQYTVTLKFQVNSASDYSFASEKTSGKINGESAEIVSVTSAFITIKYTFTAVPVPVPEHSVTIEGGTLEDGSTEGTFKEGETVKIVAPDAPEGMLFYEWIVVSGGEIIFVNENSQSTSFTMGEEDVVIKAEYRTVVKRIDITIDFPVAGELIDNEAFSYPAGNGYTMTLEWKNSDGSKPLAGATFALGEEYKAIFNVSVTDGYMFTNETEAYVNGKNSFTFDCFPHELEVRELFTATEKAPELFDITVTGGKAELDEDTTYKAKSGDEITLIADIPEGKLFVKWEVVSGSVTLADEDSATTTFTMPEEAVEIRAVFKDKPHVHEFGTLIEKKNATCVSEGMQAHYECKGCEKLFDESKNEKSVEELVIPVDPTAHDLETEWTATKDGHYHVCKNGCAVGHDEIKAHNPDRAKATETDAVKCTDCGYIIVPTIGHEHHLTAVSGKYATCTEDGRKPYYECDDCGHKFKDESGEEEITDESWFVIPGAHKFGEWIDEVQATTEVSGTKGHKDCEYCHKHFDEDGNEIEDLTIAKLPEGGGDGPSGEIVEPEKERLNGGAIAGIVVASVVVVGIGAFAVVWFVVKKKTFADLVAVLKGAKKKK